MDGKSINAKRQGIESDTFEITTLIDLIHTMPNGGEKSFFAFKSDHFTRKWSYRKVYDLTLRFSSYLEDVGIRKGDKIVIWGNNTLPLLVAFLGVINSGAVVVPLDDMFTPDMLNRIAEKVRPKLVISSINNRLFLNRFPFFSLETIEERVHDYPVKPFKKPKIRGSDLAEIVFTSGTITQPKGVMIRHGNIVSLFPPIRDVVHSLRYAINLVRGIRFLALLPISHLYGQMAEIFIPLMIKGSVIFSKKLSSTFLLNAIKKEKITVVVCVPRILEILRLHWVNEMKRRGGEKAFEQKFKRAQKYPFILRVLYFFGFHRRIGLTFLAIAVGGAKLDREMFEFYRRLGFAVFQGYGLTETSPFITIFNPMKDKKGSVGKVVGNQKIKIADDGEIWVKGPNVSDGYFEDDGATAASFQNGWLRTGDIGSLDEKGNLYFIGRKKDVIVTSDGINIYPEEIESVLKSISGVKDSAVVGIEKNGGEEVVALLLLKPGDYSGGDIVRQANAVLVPSHRIKEFYIWPEPDFPRTSLQKIKKKDVTDRIRKLKTDKRTYGGRIADIISKMSKIEPGDLYPSMKLGPDLGLSSLDRLELALYLEDHHQTEIQDLLLDEKTSVQDIENLLAGAETKERKMPMPFFSNHLVFTFLRLIFYHIILFPLIQIYCKQKVHGREHLFGLKPPVIFIANHSSHMDTPVILKALPFRFRMCLSPAMKIDYFRKYFMPDREKDKSLLRILQFLGYNLLVIFFHVYPFSSVSFRHSLDFTGELIEKQYCPLIFPEGRRTRSGEILPFKEGIGHLAVDTKVPVVSLNLKGTFEILPPGAAFPKPGYVSVHIGKANLFSYGDPETITKWLKDAVEKL